MRQKRRTCNRDVQVSTLRFPARAKILPLKTRTHGADLQGFHCEPYSGENNCFPAQQTKSIWLSSCILSSWKLFNKTKSNRLELIYLIFLVCLFTQVTSKKVIIH